jgi:hypothetical protein
MEVEIMDQSGPLVLSAPRDPYSILALAALQAGVGKIQLLPV